ncbi:transferrin-like [Melitaea cinxia]|uniref:transferrin-like n=1 Tax=Melitaea cinxia TaxID=113334 RepID=UPI001E272E7F|nr:transferrin-like [Melitaea cinxia]
MGFKEVLIVTLFVSYSTAQNYRVCMVNANPDLCANLDNAGSQVVCDNVQSKPDCALRLARGTADFGVFTEEETMLLAHQMPHEAHVVATIRDLTRQDTYAFEAVAIVPATHTGGFEGLRGGKYCHPGFDQTERWSPRVLKTLEKLVARTDRCPDADTSGKTAEEIEVDTLSNFFTSACRPGPWSANLTVDADLKNRYSSLCSLCGENNLCNNYSINMGPAINNVDNNNRHIQALECLRTNNASTVAFVAWQHVRTYFRVRNPELATSFAALCEDGSLRVLSLYALGAVTAPCSFVKQPWGAIVATRTRSSEVLSSLKQWWPHGVTFGPVTWQTILFNAVIGGSNALITYQEEYPITVLNYTQPIRSLPTIDSAASCIPARRWCTISPKEHEKCHWIRGAAYTLGIEPTVSCQLKNNMFDCLADIRDNTGDFVVSQANYGYLGRQHYRLSPVKLVENSRSSPSSFTRVVALLKNTSNITRFENLRGRKACFPEFGGLSYVAFLRVAHERSVISSSECDYARAVGEFFDSACAPGALDNSHSLAESSTYNATNLCTVCKPTVPIPSGDDFICSYDDTNKYYGKNGSLHCLADPNADIAFVELYNIEANLQAAGLHPSQVRMLCRNNTLALSTGVNLDQNCLLAFVVDSEILARRNDPLAKSLNVLLDTLDSHFGYVSNFRLIDLRMYSSFDGVSDLLFRDTAIGVSEPTNAMNEPTKNYNELFQHLESCTGSASPMPGLGTKNFFSIVTLIVMSIMTRILMF